MYTVIIAEDDPMVAMINEQYITRNGRFSVVHKCADGKSVLDWFESNTADLLILDVYMPVMNGIETLRRIREKQIPVSVIMVTAANDISTIDEALKFGAIDYLVKPFAYDRFQLALEKFIARAETLNCDSALSQSCIDNLLRSAPEISASSLPKGIQLQTLKRILEFMNWSGDRPLAGEEIGAQVNLSSVTVRRYMNYLIETGEAASELEYATGGRPCVMYTLNKTK